MKRFNQAPQLWWLRNLPEAGTITAEARREGDMLARRAELLREVRKLEQDVTTVRAEAVKAAAKEWSSEDIDYAKSCPTPKE